MDNVTLVEALYRIKAVKLGTFTLKSGLISPIYIDLRQIISYPDVLRAVANAIWEKIALLQPELICGVPYTALPIATCIALAHNTPMLMVRKEVKQYGTKKRVEGVFQPGQNCYLIEDIVTSGSSVNEAITQLTEEGVQVQHVVAFLDREQGGRQAIEQTGRHFHAAFTLSTFLTTLEKTGKLNSEELSALNAAAAQVHA